MAMSSTSTIVVRVKPPNGGDEEEWTFPQDCKFRDVLVRKQSKFACLPLLAAFRVIIFNLNTCVGRSLSTWLSLFTYIFIYVHLGRSVMLTDLRTYRII